MVALERLSFPLPHPLPLLRLGEQTLGEQTLGEQAFVRTGPLKRLQPLWPGEKRSQRLCSALGGGLDRGAQGCLGHPHQECP